MNYQYPFMGNCPPMYYHPSQPPIYSPHVQFVDPRAQMVPNYGANFNGYTFADCPGYAPPFAFFQPIPFPQQMQFRPVFTYPYNPSTVASQMSPESSVGMPSPSIGGPIPSVYSESSVYDFNSTVPRVSRKVFVGGLPLNVPKSQIEAQFAQFGQVHVEWPQEPQHHIHSFQSARPYGPANLVGYVFLVYSNERSVEELLKSCVIENRRYYFIMNTPTLGIKPAHVRVWQPSNFSYAAPQTGKGPKKRIDPRYTVFIGGLPRTLTARSLARLFERNFGKVLYAGIDLDPMLYYPKGAGRVSFATKEGYMNALTRRFIHIATAESAKKEVEIKPYVMDNQACDECLGRNCNKQPATHFCSSLTCLQYYCHTCWDIIHHSEGVPVARRSHRPVVRLADQSRLLSQLERHEQLYYREILSRIRCSSQRSISQLEVSSELVPAISGDHLSNEFDGLDEHLINEDISNSEVSNHELTANFD